jgi:hypothetical protein
VTLMMFGMLAFILLGFARQPTLRTQVLVGVIVVLLTSAYWLSGRI